MIFSVQQKLVIQSFIDRLSWQGKKRFFCISMQKSDTTSVEVFFAKHGYKVVTPDIAKKRGWNEHIYHEQYDKLFSDPVFYNHQVFEDAPFWGTDFYKIIDQKIKNANFILLTRPVDDWFKSFNKHNAGKQLGNWKHHAKIYGRSLDDVHDKSGEPYFLLAEKELLYKDFYVAYNQSVIDYFNQNGKNNFFISELYDDKKWQNLAKFCGITLKIDGDIKANVNFSENTKHRV